MTRYIKEDDGLLIRLYASPRTDFWRVGLFGAKGHDAPLPTTRIWFQCHEEHWLIMKRGFSSKLFESSLLERGSIDAESAAAFTMRFLDYPVVGYGVSARCCLIPTERLARKLTIAAPIIAWPFACSGDCW